MALPLLSTWKLETGLHNDALLCWFYDCCGGGADVLGQLETDWICERTLSRVTSSNRLLHVAVRFAAPRSFSSVDRIDNAECARGALFSIYARRCYFTGLIMARSGKQDYDDACSWQLQDRRLLRVGSVAYGSKYMLRQKQRSIISGNTKDIKVHGFQYCI